MIWKPWPPYPWQRTDYVGTCIFSAFACLDEFMLRIFLFPFCHCFPCVTLIFGFLLLFGLVCSGASTIWLCYYTGYHSPFIFCLFLVLSLILLHHFALEMSAASYFNTPYYDLHQSYDLLLLFFSSPTTFYPLFFTFYLSFTPFTLWIAVVGLEFCCVFSGGCK